MEFKYELDPVAAKLVQDGVITINVVFTRTGVDAWARSVQAHPRLEVFPHHSLTLGELSNVFSKHQSLSQFSTNAIPEATSSHAVVPSRKAILENTKFKPAHRSDSDDGMETMSVDAAQMRINTYGLNRINKGGVINSLPVDSLTSFDLKWHDKLDLFSRMLAVADKLGNNVILGRITTQKELNIPGVRDLKSWWDSADYQKRLRVLSNQKKLNVTTLQYREHPLLRAVEVLPCPFRGIAENLVVESDDDFKIFSDDTEN